MVNSKIAVADAEPLIAGCRMLVLDCCCLIAERWLVFDLPNLCNLRIRSRPLRLIFIQRAK